MPYGTCDRLEQILYGMVVGTKTLSMHWPTHLRLLQIGVANGVLWFEIYDWC